METTFPGVLAFAFLALMLLVGTVARARIPFLGNALVPACLIGGIVGFVLLALGLGLDFESGDFTVFTFHFFTLSFMSLCLTGSAPGASTSVFWGGSWLTVVWTMSLVLQALVGLVVILGYNMATDGGLSAYLGMLVTHGFTQGPGQALAIGSIWETELGIEEAINFGLIYASVGFVVAFAIGVPVARAAVRKGLNANQAARIDDEFVSGVLLESTELSAGKQITHPANVDSLAFHLSILGIAYLVTDAYLGFMQPLAGGTTLLGVNLGIIFSHNLFFFHGLMVCVILRALMDRFGLGRFIDNETQRRITGSAVDFMVVATLMSIEFALLWTYIVPIMLVCLAVAGTTAALCFGFGRQLSSLGIERSLTAFGCCCGSTGSGLVLLRILDPSLSTPIAKELAFFNVAILVVSSHILMFMAPVLPSFGLGTVVAVYCGTFVVGAVAMLAIARRVGPTSSDSTAVDSF